MNTLGELLDELYEEMRRPPERYPIVRSGPRDPIPSIVRLSVYRRDGFRCRECGIGARWPAVRVSGVPVGDGRETGVEGLRTLYGEMEDGT